MLGLIVCTVLVFSVIDGSIHHVVNRDTSPVLPPGFPDNIPLIGDPINDGEYFPGFNYTNPCNITHDPGAVHKCYGDIYHVSIPDYPRLYYTCHGPQATLYSCRQNTTFDEQIARCVSN
ncbi:hypothetical protein CHUAL_004858 [Chamberlinius hualienensis]